jgi:hypothetical protein
MRLLATVVAFVTLGCSLSSPHSAQALEPAASPQATVHISVTDAGEYVVGAARDGQPSTLWTRVDGDLLGLKVRFVGPNLHCTIQRVGAHPYEYDGDVGQARRVLTVGRFPGEHGHMVELKVRVSDGFNP